MASASEENSPYWIHSRIEIVHTLNQLRKSAALLTAEMQGSGHQFVTVILQLNAEGDYFLIDAPAEATILAQIERGNEFLLRGNFGGIRVEWRANEIAPTKLAGSPALRVNVPPRLMKLQRRAYFRVAMPVTRPASCAIPLADGHLLQCRVADISLGGVSLTTNPREPLLTLGTIHEGCQLTLQDQDLPDVTLQICYASETSPAGNRAPRRYGCKFHDLTRLQLTAIQRYVSQLERTRRAMDKS